LNEIKAFVKNQSFNSFLKIYNYLNCFKVILSVGFDERGQLDFRNLSYTTGIIIGI